MRSRLATTVRRIWAERRTYVGGPASKPVHRRRQLTTGRKQVPGYARRTDESKLSPPQDVKLYWLPAG